LGFLRPVSQTSAGPKIIQGFRKYHDPNAGDFVVEIINYLENGKTVIIDLGNAPPEVTNYFSVHLSKAIFHTKCGQNFLNNKLGNHYLQLYLLRRLTTEFPSKEQEEVEYFTDA
jgi:hypothetical protein